MTQKQKIIELLSDGGWHCSRELHQIAWRFGARLWDLRNEGYKFEKRSCDCIGGNKTKFEDWKLGAGPVLVKDRHYITNPSGQPEFIPDSTYARHS
jgi:hypothetical protein